MKPSSLVAPSPRYRVLLIEDEPLWIDLMKRYRNEVGPDVNIERAATRQEVTTQLAKAPFHFVSVDQNIPDRAGETVIPENGLDVLRTIIEMHPFTKCCIYTAYGRIAHANRAGQLGGTEYIEKRLSDSHPESLDIKQYFNEKIKKFLHRDYFSWSLGNGRAYLPPMLDTSCADILRAINERGAIDDGLNLLTRITNLWERSLALLWAQTCMIAHRNDIELEAFDDTVTADSAYRETMLARLWDALENRKALGAWRRIILPPEFPVPGATFVAASKTLRVERNPHSHARLEAFATATFDVMRRELLPFIDVLAGLAENPMLISPQVHRSDRTRLQFIKIVQEQKVASIRSNADVPSPPGRNRIYLLHRGPNKERLIDLFPLISIVDRPGRRPEPAMFEPIPQGRRIRRLSLINGTEIDMPATRDEVEALRSIFGKTWGV